MQCNKLSGDVWNHCVEIDNSHMKSMGKWMTIGELQTAVKGFNNLHAKGIYHVYRKYYAARSAMFKSIKAKHSESNKVKLPYKQKKFFNTGWDYQSIICNYDKGTIKLAKANLLNKDGKRAIKQRPVICYAKTIPQNIVEIELLYKNGLYLAIKYKEDDIQCDRNLVNSASIDLGEIHAITSIDNNGNAVIITGRKLRSIKQLRNKNQAKIKSKMSKCKKGSKQYKKYNRALYSVKFKSDKQILDCVHKITKLYLDYCLENEIGIVYYGDLDSATRGRNVAKFLNQKLSQWNYGEIVRQLHNKLERYGIKLIKVEEYYSSQKCPCCGTFNKTKSRNYICGCGYVQHRDITGAINILNHNSEYHIERYSNKKYLRIA